MRQFYDEVVDTAEKQNYRDYKTALQELIQKDYGDRLYYEVISESGPDHDKVFTVQVKLKNNILGRGTGKSKKEAEQIAAKAALEELKG
jgi:ribonuclease-3